jgi:transcriptional regulator with XRE-family HTH domain
MSNANSNVDQIGKKIRLARINKGLKQYELAKSVDLSSNYMSLIESGRKKPSLRALSKIAKALEVNASSLLEDDSILNEFHDLSKKYDLSSLIRKLESLGSQ